MPVVQAHEQNNELVIGFGGSVGLVENSSALRKWMIAGPEQARLLKVFEQFILNVEKSNFTMNVLCSKNITRAGTKINVVQAISKIGNSFLDATPELLVLETIDVLKFTMNQLPRITLAQYMNPLKRIPSHYHDLSSLQ